MPDRSLGASKVDGCGENKEHGLTTVNSDDKSPPVDGSDALRQLLPGKDPAPRAVPQSIAGVIRRVGGKVSPEEQAEAKRLLKVIEKIRSRLPEASGGDPRASGTSDPGASATSAKPKHAELDDILAPGLAEAGYRKVAKLTYRGEWSTPEVEHVLTFETYGVPQDYLCGDAGFRNRAAEAFATECRQRYAHRGILRALRDSGYKYPPWFCSMRFSIGGLFGWKTRELIDMTEYSSDQLARTITELVRSKLIPFVTDIVAIASLLNLLERDDAPMIWVRTGGSRFAIVAYLAAAIGADRVKTRATLLKHAGILRTWVDAPRLTPETYIEHILDDAEAAVRSRAIEDAGGPKT